MKLNILERKKLCISSIIYIILTLAAFSDILRIWGTPITFFRLSLPICLIVIALYPKWLKRFIIVLMSFVIVNGLQSIIFYKIIFPELQWKIQRFFEQTFWFSCVFVVFFLCAILKENMQDKFESDIVNFIIYVGSAYIVIQIIGAFFPEFVGSIELDNKNNYGCFLCALLPVLLVKWEYQKKKRFILLIMALVVVTYMNDSKAALIGEIMQIFLFCCVSGDKNDRKHHFIFRYVSIIVGVGLVITLFIINPHIHEYTLRGSFLEPIIRVLTNDPYPIYTTSITFRTNTTLYAFQQLWRTGFIGLGAGNTGIMLKQQFPNLNPNYKLALAADSLSLHNAWLETLLDFGIVILICYIIVIWYAIKKFFIKVNLTQCEKMRVVFILSMPIWIMSTSGIHTLYYVFIMISFLVLGEKDKIIFENKG